MILGQAVWLVSLRAKLTTWSWWSSARNGDGELVAAATSGSRAWPRRIPAAPSLAGSGWGIRTTDERTPRAAMPRAAWVFALRPAARRREGARRARWPHAQAPRASSGRDIAGWPCRGCARRRRAWYVTRTGWAASGGL